MINVKTVYAKDIPKDWYSAVDSSLRTVKVKDTSVSVRVGDVVAGYKIAENNHWLDLKVEDMDGVVTNTTTPRLLELHLKEK